MGSALSWGDRFGFWKQHAAHDGVFSRGGRGRGIPLHGNSRAVALNLLYSRSSIRVRCFPHVRHESSPRTPSRSAGAEY